MCPMLVNGLSDGPAMVLSPPQDRPFAQFPSPPVFNSPGNSYPSNPSSLFGNGHTNSSSFTSSPPSQNVPKPTRKRSRDEAAFDEALDSTSAPPAPAPAPQQEEPVYGEGMVLLNPRTGMGLSAESQTGTWYEQASEHAAASAPPVSSRSKMPSNDIPGRKSQRLDTSARGLDDIALSSIHQRLQNTNDDHRRALNPANGSRDDPLVDDATRLLGISWQQISDDPDIAAAVRGWKKFIDNQYSSHLQDSRILMKNRALDAFLVSGHPLGAASPAFYLFTEDLTQAQLVGSTWEITLQNLRTVPIALEGSETLRAAGKSADRPLENNTVFCTNPSEAGLPLLQTISAHPAANGVDSNGGGEMGSGMEVDS